MNSLLQNFNMQSHSGSCDSLDATVISSSLLKVIEEFARSTGASNNYSLIYNDFLFYVLSGYIDLALLFSLGFLLIW